MSMNAYLTEYVSLDALAAMLNLPRPYLRHLAQEGRVPSLNVNGRLRFDERQVREALRLLATQDQGSLGGKQGPRVGRAALAKRSRRPG